MEQLLKQVSSKQQAELQIPALISKVLGTRHSDCMANGTIYENWFRHGDFRQTQLVNDFTKAWGFNFHSLGPKDPISKTFTATSDTGMKHKLFIPSHFSELEDSASNLLSLVTIISGEGNESYAKSSIEKLLIFYKNFKSDIKSLCSIRANLLADIQIQLGNEWNSFLTTCSTAPPTEEPDFQFVTNQLAKGKLPIPFLPHDFKHPGDTHPLKPGGNQKLSNSGDEKYNSPTSKVNKHPQIKMDGNTSDERSQNFKAAFGRKDAFKSLNIPRVDQQGNVKLEGPGGHLVCMNFHIRHVCRQKPCNYYHGKLSEEFINRFLQKSREKNLKVVKA
jgi:hypothetical protein